MTSTNDEQLTLSADGQQNDIPGVKVDADDVEDGEALLVSSVEDAYDELRAVSTGGKVKDVGHRKVSQFEGDWMKCSLRTERCISLIFCIMSSIYKG